MSEVEVYSVNKLTFWAMDKNVVGKKNSRRGGGGGITQDIIWYTCVSDKTQRNVKRLDLDL